MSFDILCGLDFEMLLLLLFATSLQADLLFPGDYYRNSSSSSLQDWAGDHRPAWLQSLATLGVSPSRSLDLARQRNNQDSSEELIIHKCIYLLD